MSSSINENLKADADILQSDQQSSGGSISGSIGFNDYDNLRKIFGPVAGIEPLGAMQPYSSGEISQTLPNEARVSSSTMITTDSRDNNIQALKTRIAQQQRYNGYNNSSKCSNSATVSFYRRRTVLSFYNPL